MAGSDKMKVCAVYTFKGQNTDELNFKKGDIITVTQTLDGGWWEGTLNDKTGWFPSNYVREIAPDRARSPPHVAEIEHTKRESIRAYHAVVVRDIIETETQYISELDAVIQNYLRPLRVSDVLTQQEFQQLCANLDEVIDFQKKALASLIDASTLPYHQQRIGSIFIAVAPKLKDLHGHYCSNHPWAVLVLTKYKERLGSFMESHGAPAPGIMLLTTSLSLPFRRLSKYPVMLKELERQTDEGHADRGDTQRSVLVYREIIAQCERIRKQKEMEIEVLVGNIKGWEGEAISTLGELKLMTSVSIVGSPGSEKKDRYFVLFPYTLVVLSVSHRLSCYIYEGQIQLAHLTVKQLEDTEQVKNAFELSGRLIEQMTVICASSSEQQQWLELLAQHIKVSQVAVGKYAVPQLSAGPSPALVAVTEHKPGRHEPLPVPLHGGPLPFPPSKPWSISRLRPAPPIRPCLPVAKEKEPLAIISPRSHRKAVTSVVPNKKLDIMAADDQMVLRVIEGYCTSAKTRYTVNSALLDSPQVLIAEDEKIIIEETKGNQTIVEERSLVDTVYALKDKVTVLENQITWLSKHMEDEKQARKRLEVVLRKSVRSVADIKCSESRETHS